MAASVDSEEDTKKLSLKESFSFPIAYGLTALDIAEKTGAYYNDERGFLHATGFLLRPDGTVVTAVYASGPVGRLTPNDALRIIKYYRNMESKTDS